MTPYQTWKKNRARSDLRKLTRDFEKNFKIKSKCTFEPGKVYAITYTTDNSIPTDKHHVTPIILCLGSFRDENGHVNVRGINILYLNTKQSLEILDDCYLHIEKTATERVLPIVKIHDKFMKVFPWTFKNYVSHRIKTSIEIQPQEWGMIPLLYKYLFGNFNATALNEDFQHENRTIKKIEKQVPKEKQKEIEEEEEIVTEDLVVTNFEEDEEDII